MDIAYDPVAFGERLRIYREKCHLSQKELSEKSGVSQSTIARLEVGNARSANLSKISKLAEILQVSFDDLFIDSLKKFSGEKHDKAEDKNKLLNELKIASTDEIIFFEKMLKEFLEIKKTDK